MYFRVIAKEFFVIDKFIFLNSFSLNQLNLYELSSVLLVHKIRKNR